MKRKTRVLKYFFLASFLINLNLIAQNSTISAKKVFEQCIVLNSKFLLSQEEDDRHILEKYTEENLHPVLHGFQDSMCSKFDSCQFETFTKLLLINGNSADELPISTLGHIFICQTEKMNRFIKNMSKKDKDIIIALTEIGFLNESMKKPECDYSQQKVVLNLLKGLQ